MVSIQYVKNYLQAVMEERNPQIFVKAAQNVWVRSRDSARCLNLRNLNSQ